MSQQLTEIIIRKLNELKANKDERETWIVTPITHIDGVECSATFELTQRANNIVNLGFVIESNQIYDSDRDDAVALYTKYESFVNDTEVTAQSRISRFCEFIMNELDRLKLTLDGKLSSNNSDNQSTVMNNIFNDMPNVKVKQIDSCCVCYNPTRTLTRCKHPLCYRCWSSVSRETEDGDTEMLCPICREDICYT